MPRMAQSPSGAAAARAGGEQRRGGAAGRRRCRILRHRRRGGGRAVRPECAGRQHRGRPEQHHPLPGARRAGRGPFGARQDLAGMLGAEPAGSGARAARAARGPWRVDDQVRVAAVAHRDVGICVLYRRGRPSVGHRRRQGAGRTAGEGGLRQGARILSAPDQYIRRSLNMSIAALAPEYVRAISPYQPGKPISELAREMGLNEQDIIKLASNENPLGMSPRARQAALAALDDSHRYPDGNGFELKAALAERHGVGMDQIVLGNGSNDVLELAARVFLIPGSAAVYSRHAFADYPLATHAMGAPGIETPARDWGHDLQGMRAAIKPGVRMIFIANPDNHTGTLLKQDELERFIESVPQEVVVVLDEAYNEYLAPDLRGDSVAWLKRFPNLVVTRTFSKAYGLAGFRVGYAFAQPEVADLMNRVRQPFNVNGLALAAATAALADDVFVAESYRVNRNGMEQIVRGLKRLGLAHIPSHGNFVSFRVADAAKVNIELLKQGVIVRPVGIYRMPNFLRVTIGREH